MEDRQYVIHEFLNSTFISSKYEIKYLQSNRERSFTLAIFQHQTTPQQPEGMKMKKMFYICVLTETRKYSYQ